MAHLHVVVPIVTQDFRRADQFQDLFHDGTRVSQSQIETGPASIESELDEALAQPGVVKQAILAERDGAEAIVIDCMGDPGLEAAREVVSVPVLGPCQTSMHVASMLAHRFSVITVLERLAHGFRNRAEVYGLGRKLASTRSVDIPVLDLENDDQQLLKALTLRSIEAIEADGAHALIFGCTGMLGYAHRLEEALAREGYPGIPVVDPIPTTLNVAKAVISSRLTHSDRTYPSPPEKMRSGYPGIS